MNPSATVTCSRCDRPLPDDAPDALCPYCLLALGDDDATEDWTQPGLSGFTPPTVDELREHFSEAQIEVLELHGRGGMGAVYRAHQQKLSRDVALKILPPELALTPGFDERFQREAQVLAKLDHTNIVDVYDFGKAGPYSYLLLEFVEGVNLRELIVGGEAGPADALEIVPQLCDALQFAHDAGVVHRDVKPENILINTRGRVKITDFGLAKLASSASQQNLTQTRQTMGTPQYMAPEQIERPREVDHRADIYAMGVVFYELLTGELPLGRFDPPGRKSGTSRRLDRVVMKTLEKDPDKRFEQASEVKSAVEKEPRIDPPSETASATESPWIDKAKGGAAAAMHKGQELFDAKNQLPLVPVVVGGFAILAYGLALIAALALVAGGRPDVCIGFMFFSTASAIGTVALFHFKESELGPVSKSLSLPLVAMAASARATVKRDHWVIVCVTTLIVGASVTLIAMVNARLDELIPVGCLILLVSAGFARWRISDRTSEELSSLEKWGYYPSILIVLVPLALAIVVSGPVLCTSILIEQFPHSQSPPFLLTAGVCVATCGWLAVLSLAWGIYPDKARALLRPIVNKYNGRGTYVFCALAAMGCFGFLALFVSILTR